MVCALANEKSRCALAPICWPCPDWLESMRRTAALWARVMLRRRQRLIRQYRCPNQSPGYLRLMIAFRFPLRFHTAAMPLSLAIRTAIGIETLCGGNGYGCNAAPTSAHSNTAYAILNNRTSTATNLTQPISRIESVDFWRNCQAGSARILSQASTAMLARTNRSQQGCPTCFVNLSTSGRCRRGRYPVVRCRDILIRKVGLNSLAQVVMRTALAKNATPPL